jgi:hypothetical protein
VQYTAGNFHPHDGGGLCSLSNTAPFRQGRTHIAGKYDLRSGCQQDLQPRYLIHSRDLEQRYARHPHGHQHVGA